MDRIQNFFRQFTTKRFLSKLIIFLASLDICCHCFFLIQDFNRNIKYEISYFHVESLCQLINVALSMMIPVQLIYGVLKVRNACVFYIESEKLKFI